MSKRGAMQNTEIKETEMRSTSDVPEMQGLQNSAGQSGEVRPACMDSITVKPDRIVFEVSISDPRYRQSSPKLAAFVLRRYPNLSHHACVNNVGETFGAVIEQTTTAHMLEHLAIELLTDASSDPLATFVGTTEWRDENRGMARIEMSFDDDLKALRAFNEALSFLNVAVLTCLS